MPKPVNWEKLKTLEYIDFECQCPDFTKRQAANPSDRYRPAARNWQYSSAGVKPGQWCKHIWATVINNGWLDLVDIPTDYPIEPPQKIEKSFQVKNFSTNRGDSFY